jgi:hypothetical protein
MVKSINTAGEPIRGRRRCSRGICWPVEEHWCCGWDACTEHQRPCASTSLPSSLKMKMRYPVYSSNRPDTVQLLLSSYTRRWSTMGGSENRPHLEANIRKRQLTVWKEAVVPHRSKQTEAAAVKHQTLFFGLGHDRTQHPCDFPA